MSDPAALIDAAIAYGAERILSGRHDDPFWAHRQAFRREDDERLFRELLHQLALYGGLYLDQSSIGEEISTEVLSLAKRICSGQDVRKETGPLYLFHADDTLALNVSKVQASLCEYLASRLEREPILVDKLLSAPVPWAYHEPAHHDREAIVDHLTRLGVDSRLVPFVIFAWRGVVYGAIAQSERRNGRTLTAYVAAPGRVIALRYILAAVDVERFDFPREAWRELIHQLPTLPEQGYDFSFLQTLPAVDTSPLSSLIATMPPQTALDYVLDWREGVAAKDLRAVWGDLLDAGGNSTIIGSTNIQIARNVDTGRDFKQTIIARPRHG